MAILSLIFKCLCANGSSADHSEAVHSVKKKKEPTSHHNEDRNSLPVPVDSEVKLPRHEYRIFEYSELEKATNCFSTDNYLGKGSYGAVYRGTLEDGLRVAIKYFFQDDRIGIFWSKAKKHEETKGKFLDEVRILGSLSHENLVRFYGCTSPSKDDLFLVQEYIPNGTLARHLNGKRGLKTILWPTRLNIVIQIASALAYLHASSIIHRDVKPSNILVDENFNVKVADFGVSRLFPDGVTHVTTGPSGSSGYIDPEYLISTHLSPGSDVYSFGVVLVELISSLPALLTLYDGPLKPNTEEPRLAVYAEALIQRGKIEDLVDPALGFETEEWVELTVKAVGQLAFRCLHYARHVRPSMAEVLDHLLKIGGKNVDVDNAYNFELDPVTSHNSFREAHVVDRLPDDYFDKVRV